VLRSEWTGMFGSLIAVVAFPQRGL